MYSVCQYVFLLLLLPGHGCLAVRAYSTGHNNDNKTKKTNKQKKKNIHSGRVHASTTVHFFFCFPTGNTTNPPPTTYYPPLTTQGPSGNENKHKNNFQPKRIQIEILKMLAQSLMFLLKIATSPYPTDWMKSENAVPPIIVKFTHRCVRDALYKAKSRLKNLTIEDTD